MELKQSLGMRLEQKLTLGQHQQFASILEMTNEQLFTWLKQHEGTGEAYPMISLEKVMTVPRHLDVWVHGGIIHEASSNYIQYPVLNGTGSRSGRRMFSLLRWMLATRERLLKAATGFILRHHHDFFWGKGRLHPITIAGAVRYMNAHPDEFFLDQPLDYTSFTRVLKNKQIEVEGRIYSMRFFFTMCKIHPVDFASWLRAKLAAEPSATPYSDAKLQELFFKERGITIARRTVTNYRSQLGIRPAHRNMGASRHKK